jgi:hypothetical protein
MIKSLGQGAGADGGSSVSVTDGSTTVAATSLTFSGATVTDGGSGEAQVAISGGLVPVSGTSHTLSASDNGASLVFSNGSAITLTVASGLGAEFSCVIVQKGTGQITPTAAGGVTISSRQSYTKTAGQYAVMSLLAVAADTFILFGDGA